MKKMLICCATLCVTLTLFCVAAFATELQAKVEPVDAKTVNVTEKQGGANRVFTVTKDSGVKAGDLYLVLIQKGAKATDKPKPTEENVYYMEVQGATDSSLSMEAMPKDMDAGSYAVYLSDWSESGKGAAKGVATITLSAATPSDPGDSGDSTTPSDPGDSTKPGDGGDSTPGGETTILYGDVNGNGSVDGRDLTALARYLADRKDYLPGGSKAINLENANCNGKGGVDGRDLTSLARHLADRQEYAVLPH